MTFSIEEETSSPPMKLGVNLDGMSSAFDDVIPTEAIESIARFLLSTEQFFRLTIDLKKLKLTDPLGSRIINDDDFVSSVSLSYLTAPLFQSSDVFHAVQISRNPKDRSELLISDGFCSFRFEDRLRWIEFVKLFLPSRGDSGSSVASEHPSARSFESGISSTGDTALNDEPPTLAAMESGGASLPIFVRARLNKHDKKSVTVGVATLTFESFLSRQSPSLQDVPQIFFENLVSAHHPLSASSSERLTSTCSAAEADGYSSKGSSSMRNPRATFRELPVFEGLMKIPIITRESATIAGILTLGIAIDLMLHTEELAALLARSLHSVKPLKPFKTAPAKDEQVSSPLLLDKNHHNNNNRIYDSSADPDEEQEFLSDSQDKKRSETGPQHSGKSASDSAPTSIFSFQKALHLRQHQRSHGSDGVFVNRTTEKLKAALTRRRHSCSGRTSSGTSNERSPGPHSSRQTPPPPEKPATTHRDKIENQQTVNNECSPASLPRRGDSLLSSDKAAQIIHSQNGLLSKLKSMSTASEGAGMCKPQTSTAPSTTCPSNNLQTKQPQTEFAQQPAHHDGNNSSSGQLLQCEVLLMKLAQEQAQGKFREEMRIAEARADENLAELRYENQKLRRENKALESKLMDFEKRLIELQRSVESNVSVVSPGARSISCDVHGMLPNHSDESPPSGCLLRGMNRNQPLRIVNQPHPNVLNNNLQNTDTAGRTRGEAVLIATVDDLRRQNERLMQLLLRQGGFVGTLGQTVISPGGLCAHPCGHAATASPVVPVQPKKHVQPTTTSSSGPPNVNTTTSTSLLDQTPSWSSHAGMMGGVSPLQGIHTVHPIYHSPAGVPLNGKSYHPTTYYGCNGVAAASNWTPGDSIPAAVRYSHTRTGRLPPPRKPPLASNGNNDCIRQKGAGTDRDGKGIMRIPSSSHQHNSEGGSFNGSSTLPVKIAGEYLMEHGGAQSTASSKRRGSNLTGRQSISSNADGTARDRHNHENDNKMRRSRDSISSSRGKAGGGGTPVLASRQVGSSSATTMRGGRGGGGGARHSNSHRHHAVHGNHSNRHHRRRMLESTSSSNEEEEDEEEEEEEEVSSSIPSSPLSSRSKRLLAEHLKRRRSPNQVSY